MRIGPAVLTLLLSSVSVAADGPRMLAYSASPGPYFNECAADVARVYDGLFFVVGEWDEGVRNCIGLGPDTPAATDWAVQVKENIRNLRGAGATENMLGVSFGEGAPWPSPETLLSEEYTARFTQHFGALGGAARDLGFRGVSIDIEYPYKRYELDHAVWTCEGYTAEDLMIAAGRQGRAAMSAVLDAYPEAVVLVLPGELNARPLGRAFNLGMFSVMAERDAPGGFHLGLERGYCMNEGLVSQLAVTRCGDGTAEAMLDGRQLDYWKRRCSVAPGVWPLHRIETGGKDYPVQPWPAEMAELEVQMAGLRATARRYIWSFTAHPVWYARTPENEARFSLPRQDFPDAEQVVSQWHRILADRRAGVGAPYRPLLDAIRRYDRGRISYDRLCDRFGTPAAWMVLGPLDNPFVHRAFSTPAPIREHLDMDVPVQGRDGAVRWFPFHNNDPQGVVSLMAALDWRASDDCALQLATAVVSRRAEHAVLHVGWDDGLLVTLNDAPVFDQRAYPERGHGLLFQDRYVFEEEAPVELQQGRNLLSVFAVNARGSFGYSLRITDASGVPLPGVKFELPRRLGRSQ